MNNDFEMNYDNDPADCNGYSSGADYSTESSDEFSPAPSEFGTPDKTSEENDAKDFFNSPGIIAPLDYADGRTDLGSLYDTESAEDNGCGCGCGDDDCPGYGGDGDKGGCGCGYSDNDSETSEEFEPSPEDETAATSDELYNNSTVSAREKYSLDDYEIISDVLGSEKQLVKLYSTALCESAEESLRGVIRENLIECAKDQYSTFEYMEKRGLYQTEQAPEDQIAQAKQQFGPLTSNCNCGCGCDN
ncbi:MAG: spore coat protein [Clostridiales bacterium]|nr:spore coat protein [Clostridiales bacterium]